MPWWLIACRDQIIISSAAFAVVRHAPAVQPAPRAGGPQAGRTNRPAAARVRRRRCCSHDSRFAFAFDHSDAATRMSRGSRGRAPEALRSRRSSGSDKKPGLKTPGQTREVSIDIRTVIHEIMRIKKRNAAELLSISKIRSNIRIENLDRKQC